jgi:hypothetical protein
VEDIRKGEKGFFLKRDEDAGGSCSPQSQILHCSVTSGLGSSPRPPSLHPSDLTDLEGSRDELMNSQINCWPALTVLPF